MSDQDLCCTSYYFRNRKLCQLLLWSAVWTHSIYIINLENI
jgi:hypothetical protein